jgi:2,3-bisphosphoglycerate-independent phosphoglycerate mutase
MDGRDTLPTNGAGYLQALQQKMREYNSGKIASVNGRYYAMDRYRRW